MNVLTYSYFNSRPSARGDAKFVADTGYQKYFNSRPSARGDGNSFWNSSALVISIHAPPRGATITRLRSNITSVFQFTPLREGRPDMLTEYSSLYQFQFTPLREGRLERPCLYGQRLAISIHAPPRGATKTADVGRCFIHISIHAPPRGATGTFLRCSPCRLFQFTPLREGRPVCPGHD